MAMIENDNPDFWFTKYKYYSSPDGTDPLGKLLSCVNPAIQGSMFVGIHDVFLRSQCTTYSHALQRMAYWMIPMTSIAAAYPSVTYISTRLRGKDDPLNHAMGGTYFNRGAQVVWDTLYILLYNVKIIVKTDSIR